MLLKLSTKDLVLCSLFTAVICVSALIAIPLPQVPVTMQVAAVFTSAAILGGKRSVCSVCAYVLLGVAGFPVFSGMGSGIGHLLGPTGGYIIGFIPAAYIIGTVAKKTSAPYYSIKLAAAMLVALTVLYAIGTIQFSVVTGRPFIEAFMMAVVPFIIFDVIKIVISVTLTYYVAKYQLAA